MTLTSYHTARDITLEQNAKVPESPGAIALKSRRGKPINFQRFIM